MRMTAGTSKPRSTVSLRRLSWVVGGTLAFTSVLLISIIAYTGFTATADETRAERVRIENSLNQSVARALDQQKSVAWWDDAVKYIVHNPDWDFIDSNFGIFLTETYGHDEVYILNSEDEAFYAFQAGERLDPGIFERRRKQVDAVLSATRTGNSNGLRERPDAFAERQKNYNVLKSVLEVAAWKGAILTIDDKPAIVAALTIVPNVEMELLTQRPFVLLSLNWVDKEFLEQLSLNLLIPDIQLSSSSEPGAGATVSELFLTDEGGSPGYLSWTTKRPGHALLTVVLPLVTLAVLGMATFSTIMLRRLIQASKELSAREAAARFDATHDSLSMLPNRHAFVQKASDALQPVQHARSSRRIIVGYLDIDRFKDINDTLGHHVGDELIAKFGQRLREFLAPTDFLARFGGDEFAIFRLADASALEEGLDTLVQRAFERPLIVAEHEIRVTASLGLAQSPDHGTTTEDLMRNADIALYAAKRRGRSEAAWFTADMAEELQLRREVELDLLDAMAADQLELHYQPIVSASSNQIVAVEALLRWHHPVKGPIAPSVFIPIAEEGGMMPKLGEWVLRRAMEFASRLPDLGVAINLSPAQFHHTNIETLLRKLIIETGVSPRRITLEITEGLLLEPSPKTRETLHAIRKLGFQIALDDFGTGFSSLNYLIEFRFDKLKIDRSFVSAISRTGSAPTVVQAVIQLGHALQMEVVAEGIETVAEGVTMRFWGSDLLQGYFFSKALPADGLGEFVSAYNSSHTARELYKIPPSISIEGA